MRKFIKKILPRKIYDFLKKIYLKLKNIRYFFYNTQNDLNYNLNLLKEINLDVEQIKNNFKLQNVDFFDEDKGWHYKIFSGFSKKDNLKILEIGTHIGAFTNFLSSTFKSSTIYSVDLNQEDPLFVNQNNRNDKDYFDFFIKERRRNLSQKNIIFIEINSFDLLKKFEKNYFDIIWLDGDHTGPQVTFDVLSSFYLLKPNGILVTDDLLVDKKQEYKNLTDGYISIKYLSEIKKLKTYYFIKRIQKNNANPGAKRFISYSIKISN